MDKLKLAVKETGIKQVVIGGGVTILVLENFKKPNKNTVGKHLYQNLNTPPIMLQ
jgi:hypothetical protein